MPRREGFDAVQPALLAAQGGARIGLHHPVDVMLVHLLGNAAVQRLAYWRRADSGEPITRVGVTATTKMGDLTHQRRAELVHTDAEALKMRDDLITANVELAKNVR